MGRILVTHLWSYWGWFIIRFTTSLNIPLSICVLLIEECGSNEKVADLPSFPLSFKFNWCCASVRLARNHLSNSQQWAACFQVGCMPSASLTSEMILRCSPQLPQQKPVTLLTHVATEVSCIGENIMAPRRLSRRFKECCHPSLILSCLHSGASFHRILADGRERDGHVMACLLKLGISRSHGNLMSHFPMCFPAILGNPGTHHFVTAKTLDR